jgi:hypothetical protein
MTCRRFLFPILLLAAMSAAAQSTAPRVVTLKAADGTPLKASYSRLPSLVRACCCSTSATDNAESGTIWRRG